MADLFIAIPVLTDVPKSFFDRFVEMDLPTGTVVRTSGKRPLHNARNELVSEARKQDAKHILFLNSDIVPPKDLVKRMLAHKKPIVSALYYRKHYPFSTVAYKKGEEGEYIPATEFGKGLQEVDATGLGCMMIDLKVFDKLPMPFFKWVPAGEEFYFAINAQSEGYKIHLDPAIQCDHLGTLALNYKFFKENVKIIEESI